MKFSFENLNYYLLESPKMSFPARFSSCLIIRASVELQIFQQIVIKRGNLTITIEIIAMLQNFFNAFCLLFQVSKSMRNDVLRLNCSGLNEPKILK